MEKFLHLVAKDLFIIHKSRLNEITVVFPSRRAGVFFQKYLSEVVETTIWAPKIITINDLMKELSGMLSNDRISLVIQLYDVYRKVLNTHETFDSFYFWGEMLINDFDDIDKYLVEVNDLFQNIASEKEIETIFDSLDSEQKKIIETFLENIKASRDSKQKQDFVAFWKALLPLYREYEKRLLKTGKVYEGKIYRKVAENILHTNEFDLSHHRQFAFVGFNVLNKCEETLFEYLASHNKARFYWDYDHWYLDNENHEARHFIHSNLRKFPNALDQEKFNNFTNPKNIQCLSLASKSGQAKILPGLLQSLDSRNEDTAIILADESLLDQIMRSIPLEYKGINVTMGYPMKNSHVYTLIHKLFSLQRNARAGEPVSFYQKDVLFLINHTTIQRLQGKHALALEQKIKGENIIQVPQTLLHEEDLFQIIFQKAEARHIGFIHYINTVFKSLLTILLEEERNADAFEKEIIYHIVRETNKLIDILQEPMEGISLEVQFRIVNQVLGNQTISFVGEPIADLQIMGILESRTLDFKNVILLSMNEGIIPKISVGGSFIPYRLREGFGLQTIQHQDSVFSYYFFRLLQRAENIFLVYSSNAEGLQSGEPSRYIQQLKYDPHFKLNEITYGYEIEFPGEQAIIIKKNPQIQQLLSTYFNNPEKYISPSALNAYLDCSLRFYFRYIQRLEAEDEIEEHIDSARFGNILHNTLHTLYLKFQGKQVTSEELETILKDEKKIRSELQKEYQKEYKIKNFDHHLPGENEVILDVIFSYIKSILKLDSKRAPFSIHSLEQKYVQEYNLEFQQKNQIVRVGGKIDRIDEKEGRLIVIDYKTSSPDPKIKISEDLFAREIKNRNKEAMQILLYASIIADRFPDYQIYPELYAARKIYSTGKNEVLFLKDEKKELLHITPYVDSIKTYIQGILHDIFDLHSDFKQTGIEEHCTYCDFKNICQREGIKY